MALTGSSSASTDKLKLPDFVQKTVADFGSKAEDSWSSFRSLSEAANGLGSVDSLSGLSNYASGLIDKAQSTINGAVGNINNYINGFDAQLGNLLSDYIPKNLSFNTNQLGFFENILCGKLPPLGLRFPKLNTSFGFWKALDFNVNVTICGKSEVFNPLDTALSLVKTLKNGGNPIDSYKYSLLNKLVNSEVGDLLNKIGLTDTPERLLNDMLSTSKDYGYNTSLRDRVDLGRYLSSTDSISQALRGVSSSNVIQKAVYDSLLGSAFEGEKWFTDKVFGYISDRHPNLVTNSLKSTFLSDSGSTSNKFYILMENYGDLNEIDSILEPSKPVYKYEYNWKNNDNVNTLLSMGIDVTPDKVIEVNNRSLGQNTGMSVNNLLSLRTDGEKVLSNMKEDENFNKDPINTAKNVVGGLNILDPLWMYDSEGNKCLYRTKNNKAMSTLANRYLTNKTSETLNLTGNVVTSINTLHEVAIVNSFA